MGARLWVQGDGLELDAPADFPEELVELLRMHKPEILEYVRNGPRSLGAGCEVTGEAEMLELQQRIEREGYVLVRSTVLEDFVAFYNTDGDRRKVPPGFVCYGQDELLELFGEGRPEFSADTLRLIHQAKRLGARVSGVTEEEGP